MTRYIMRRKWLFLLALGTILCWNLANARGSVLRQELIDAVLALDANNIPQLMLCVLIIHILSGAVFVASQLLQNAFKVTVTDDMRKGIFSGVMKRSRKDFFSVNYSDYISAITNDLKLLKGQFIGMLFMVIMFGGGMVVSAALMFWYEPMLAVIAIVCAATMTVLPMLLGKWMENLSKEYSEKLAGLNTLLTELFSGFQVLCSFGITSHAKQKFDQYSAELKKSEQKYDGMESFYEAFAQFLSVLTQTLILVMSAWMVWKGRMTAGALVAFVDLNTNFCTSLSVVLMGIPMLRSVKPIIDRVNGLVDYEEAANGGAGPSFDKKLEVKNLSFGYQEDKQILDNISLSIQRGEKCALTGESGSGKTTLIRLLMGELDGYDGEILYDGVDLNKTDHEAVCNIASVIHQDVFLFDDTIRNNICLYDEFADEEFERVVRLSGVHKFMHQLEGGAEYQVGQRGEFLSGGQKQRIAIARALIRNTPFLVLDEGTSALDQQTAEEIESELMAISDLTLLTITHNLRKAEAYDRIFSMDKISASTSRVS